MRALTVGCIFALLVAVVLSKDVEPPSGEFSPYCIIDDPKYENVYHEADSFEVPWFTVDLDAPAKERFKHVVRPFKNKIQAVFDVLSDFLTIIPGINAWELVGDMMEKAFLSGKIMQPYQDEVQGIADELGVNLGQLAFLNIFYELSRFCTSIIAQTPSGTLYHASTADTKEFRNLDFGQLFMWDIMAQSWELSDTLKQVTVNLNFIRNGTVVFKGTTLAGHVGILTGMRPGPNGFSLSMNAKVSPDLANVIQFFAGNRPGIKFVMYFDRAIFEQANNFQEARQMIYDVQLLSGAYFILGGSKPGEGSVIVRNVTDVQFERKLFDADNDWFLLQTNYDPDQQPLFLDDRRDPGNKCMKKMGQNRISAEFLYKVLKSKTTLNKTTVHSVIMSVNTGEYLTFLQTCPNPCWPF